MISLQTIIRTHIDKCSHGGSGPKYVKIHNHNHDRDDGQMIIDENDNDDNVSCGFIPSDYYHILLIKSS